MERAGYHLIATTDPDNTVTEKQRENNNTTIGYFPGLRRHLQAATIAVATPNTAMVGQTGMDHGKATLPDSTQPLVSTSVALQGSAATAKVRDNAAASGSSAVKTTRLTPTSTLAPVGIPKITLS